MKKLLIVMLGIIFLSGCASLGIKKEQPAFTFPLIGDIDFSYLKPQVFVSREMVAPNKMATVSQYPDVSIKFVRIISNKFFQINNIQYLKDGELFVYRYLEEEREKIKKYIYKRDLDLPKEEIKRITKKLMIPLMKLQKS